MRRPRRSNALGVTCSALLSLVCIGCHHQGTEELLRDAENSVGLLEFEKAITLFEKARDLEPSTEKKAALTFRMGDLLWNAMQDPPRALRAYEEVIMLAPLTPLAKHAILQRAFIFEAHGIIDAEIEEYTRLMKYYPDDPDHTFYELRIAEGFIMRGRLAEARSELERLLQEKNLSSELHERTLFALAESYFLEKRPAQAAPLYRELVEKHPASEMTAEAHVKLAHCLEEVGYVGDAHRVLEDVKDEHPNPEVVKTHLDAYSRRAQRKDGRADKRLKEFTKE